MKYFQTAKVKYKTILSNLQNVLSLLDQYLCLHLSFSFSMFFSDLIFVTFLKILLFLSKKKCPLFSIFNQLVKSYSFSFLFFSFLFSYNGGTFLSPKTVSTSSAYVPQKKNEKKR